MLSVSDYFKHTLKAPFKNNRWSWGAVGDDGIVYLRCWNDEVVPPSKTKNGKTYVQVEWCDHDGRHGAAERLEHLKLIMAGTPCKAVICVAKDTSADPRVIASYRRDLWVLGNELVNIEGDECLEVMSVGG